MLKSRRFQIGSIAILAGTAWIGLLSRGHSGKGVSEDLPPSGEKAVVQAKEELADRLPAAFVVARPDQYRDGASASPMPNPQHAPARPARLISSVDPYAHAQLVSSTETVPDAKGDFARIRVFQTSMKYPLVRVEEKYNRDYSTGEDRVVSRLEMVADHVMLKPEPGYTAEDLVKIADSLGFQVRATLPGANVYLVSFDGNDPHAIENAMAQLKNARGVRYSEPDYIVRAN